MKTFTEQELINFFRLKVAEETKIPLEEIDPSIEFVNFGIDSIGAIFLLQHIEKYVGFELNPLLFWTYPTISSFSHHLANDLQPTQD